MKKPPISKDPEEALRDTQERFETLVQNIRDYAIFMLDADGYVTEWTTGAQHIKGYTAEEITGRHLSVFFTPEDVAAGKPQSELLEAATYGRMEREGIRVRKNGERFWVNEIATAVRNTNGELAGFTKISRDITESKKTEEALRHSEERLRILIESVADFAIMTIGTDSRISVWNPGSENLFGFSMEEAVGQPLSLLYCPEDKAAGIPEEEMRHASTGGRSEDERYHLRKDGSTIYVSGVMAPLYDLEGNLTGYVKVARDLTKRMKMEQTLRNADKQKDEYIAMLGHELRNPLAPLSSVLELLKMTHGSDPSILPSLELMSRQVNHMVHLINDLLDTSRINSGKVLLRLEETELVSAVSRAVEMSQPLFHNQRKLTVKLPEEPLYVSGDLTRIIQIVNNLLSNAVKFTLSGGEVWLTLKKAGEEARISVRDNGIGIADQYHEEIFKPFVQIDAAVDRSRGGLGLGLSMVKDLVEMHGGTVQIISTENSSGSEFTVTFPLLHQTNHDSN